MIREATINDLRILLEMSVKFIEESKSEIPLNLLSLQEWIVHLVNDSNSTCIVYEIDNKVVGCIAGSIAPHYTNTDYLVASEFAWWVEPEYRGKAGKPLIKAFELWSESNGADLIVMASLEEVNPDIMDKVYKKLGYSPKEHSYTRRV